MYLSILVYYSDVTLVYESSFLGLETNVQNILDVSSNIFFMSNIAIFHLAIPITDILLAKHFYSEGLGCEVGRENESAVIFDFYGTQLVGHRTQQTLTKQNGIYPRHLGLILPTKLDWQEICDRAKEKSLSFEQQPKLRFSQQRVEHYSFFLEDPFYNLLEFKYYSHPEVIFGGQNSHLIGDTNSNNKNPKL